MTIRQKCNVPIFPVNIPFLTLWNDVIEGLHTAGSLRIVSKAYLWRVQPAVGTAPDGGTRVAEGESGSPRYSHIAPFIVWEYLWWEYVIRKKVRSLISFTVAGF